MTTNLSELIKKYGTSLEETRKLIAELQAGMQTQQTQVTQQIQQPTYQPITYTAQEALAEGLLTSQESVDSLAAVLGKDFKVKLTPNLETQEYDYSFLTTDPFNVEYTESEVMANLQEYNAQALIQNRRLENVYQGALGVGVEEFNEWAASGEVVQTLEDGTEITQGTQEIFQALQDAGRNDYTEYILKLNGFNDDEIAEFYGDTTALATQTTEDMNFFTTLWNSVRLGVSQATFGIKEAFTSALPTFISSIGAPAVDTIQMPTANQWNNLDELKTILPPDFYTLYKTLLQAYSTQEAQAIMTERINTWNSETTQKNAILETTYEERKADLVQWIKDNPEVYRPEFDEGPIKNPSLLKDPEYYAYTIGSNAPTMLAALGIGGLVTYATQNPLAGALAMGAIMTPVEIGSIYQTAMDSGVSPTTAGNIATVAGAAAGLVETAPGVIELRAIAPAFMRAFKKELAAELTKDIVVNLGARGILKTVGQIEISEATEEVIQQAIQNAALKTANENQSLVEDIPESFVQALIATLPMALLGGGTYYSSVKASLSQSTQNKIDEATKTLVDAGVSQEQAEAIAVVQVLEDPAIEAEYNATINKTIKAEYETLKTEYKSQGLSNTEAISKATEQVQKDTGIDVASIKTTPKVSTKKTATEKPSITTEELPTAINKIRQEHGEIRADVEAIRKSLKDKTDTASKLTKQILTGTERELNIAERLLSRIETEEQLSESKIEELQERLKASIQLAKAKADTVQEYKQILTDFVKTLPLNVRGNMVTSIKNVRTQAGLEKAINRAIELDEQYNQKTLQAQIRSEVKRAKAKIKDHILKGKFTPETQRRLDVLIHNLDMDRDAAREKMTDNIQKYENGELSHEELIEANEALNYAGIDGMTSEELTNTLEYIRQLEDKGRSDRQAKREKENERIEGIRTEFVNVLTGGKGIKPTGSVSSRQLEAKPSGFDKFVNWQYSLDNLADKLSKFDTTSKPYQSPISKFVSQAHRATNRQTIGTEDAYSNMRDIIKKIHKTKSNHDVNQILNSLGEEVNLGTFEVTAEYKENHPNATTFTLKMTRDEMIQFYMQKQDPTLIDTFNITMGWSDKVFETINNTLTNEEKQLSEAIFDDYDNRYNKYSPVYSELYNIDMPRNDRYSPRFRDFDSTVAEEILTFKDNSQYASVTASSVKARTQSRRPLKFVGATKLWINHIEQMEHWYSFALTIRDLRRVFGSTQVRQAIEQYHGREIRQLIDKFINQMARDGVESAATNRTLDMLRRNFTKSILAIKPVVGLKQIPSMFAYVSEMSVPDFFSGVRDFWTAPIEHFRFLRDNSEGFRARVSQGFERDIRFAMEKHGIDKLSGKTSFVDWFLVQIRLMDTFAVMNGMWASYKSGLKQGLSQAEAIARAEDITNRTQPSFGIDTLSSIQNGGSFFKLMTMFQNQPNKYFRIVGDNLRNFKYGRGSRAKAASTIFLVWVILPAIFQYISDAFQFKPERQARAAVLGPINYLLIFGQMMQSITGVLSGDDYGYQVSPVVSTFDDLLNAVRKAQKLVDQGMDPYKDISVDDVAALIEYLAKAGGQLTGAPTPYFVQLEKLLRTKFEEGDKIGIKDFLFSQWALEPPAKTDEEKVADASLKLGEIKEGEEDTPLSDKELRIYTTKDWFSEIGSIYDDTLPSDILKDNNASKESKLWAEYETARSEYDILPDVDLYQINTDDDADTIINYYQQWQARQRITSLEKLKEFDQLYPKAYLGNVSRTTYELLKKYLESDDKDAFLEAHPELKTNPQDEWLKAHPAENALLALGGQAKILTQAAYDKFVKMLKDYDIPEDGIPELTLPPETSVENYFKYNELGEEYGYNSWEVQLVLAQDNDLREFLERDVIDTPVKQLELQVQYRDLIKQYEGYGDRDSEYYLEDKDDRAEAREKLLESNSEFADAYREIDAYSKGYSEDLVDNYKEFYKLPEWGDWRERYLLDNPDFYEAWLETEGTMKVDPDKVNPIERDELYEQYYDQFEDYYDCGGLTQAECDAKREDLLSNSGFSSAFTKVSAYDKGVPTDYIDNYIEYYDLDTVGYDQERYLQEHQDYYNDVWLGVLGNSAIDFEKVPTVEVEALYEIYQGLPSGTPRLNYRAQHPELDEWLLLVGKVSKLVGDRGDEEAEKTPWELAEEAKQISDWIKNLQ